VGARDQVGLLAVVVALVVLVVAHHRRHCWAVVAAAAAILLHGLPAAAAAVAVASVRTRRKETNPRSLPSCCRGPLSANFGLSVTCQHHTLRRRAWRHLGRPPLRWAAAPSGSTTRIRPRSAHTLTHPALRCPEQHRSAISRV
jgi:hypothetical protein